MKTNTIVGIVIDLKKKVAIAIFKAKSNLKRDIIFTLKGPHNIKILFAEGGNGFACFANEIA